MTRRREETMSEWDVRMRDIDARLDALHAEGRLLLAERQTLQTLHERDRLMHQRCPSRGPAPQHYRCGDWQGHDGPHTALIPTNAPWRHTQEDA